MKIFSINESFARAKRELNASNQQHELILFMCSAFRKMTGMNNRKPNENTIATTIGPEKIPSDAPLATIENDDKF